MITNELLQKYNVPAPRYTSYPSVPLWENNLNEAQWVKLVKRAYQDYGTKEGLSLYIHLPYCENLCTYCGCNKRITKNHSVELPYIQAVLKEWQAYLQILPEWPKLSGIHLGGGTPTFFSPEALTELIASIRSTSEVLPQAEFSFEGHPNNTTREHLQVLYNLGFRRVSYGIQDFDEKVQKTIHRIQPFAKVKEATVNARQVGYDSVNFDLIYGLPHQTLETITDTFYRVSELKPDRIAFYSYAHLPTAFPAQRSFEEFLPKEWEKRELYEKGKELLGKMGYKEVGMDHFSLPDDPLYAAKKNKRLHRNFMGYTTTLTHMLLGLGNSSISDISYAYAQNNKEIEAYKDQISKGHCTINKGHLLTGEDMEIKQLILSIICNNQAEWKPDFYLHLSSPVKNQLKEMEQEGLVSYTPAGLKVTSQGKPFVRNICAVFDKRMHAKNNHFVFSKSI